MDLTIPEKEELMATFRAVLDDDEGTNELAYTKMQEIAQRLGYVPLIDMLHHVDATDGRFYLPEGYNG